MANKVIKYRGEFDASDILASLKKIRSEMSAGGVKDSMFKDVDKDIARAESLVASLTAQIQKGFRDTSEIKKFAKDLNNLESIYSKIGVGIDNIADPKNFAKTTPELKKYQSELKKIRESYDDIYESAQDFLKSGFTEKQYKQLTKAVEAGEDLEEVYKKLAAIRIQEQINSAANSITKKGYFYENYRDNSKGHQQFFETGAVNFGNSFSNGAATSGYESVLAGILTKEFDLVSGFQALKEVMDKFGNETDQAALTTDEFAKNLVADLRQVGEALGRESGAGTSNITRSFNAIDRLGGVPTVDGGFSMGEGSEALAEYIEAENRLKFLLEAIEEEEKKATQAAVDGANQAHAGVSQAAEDQEKVFDAARDSTEELQEEAQASQKLNDTFASMKNAVQQFLSIGSAITAVRNVIRQTFTDVQNIDKAFTEIAMVTSYSVQEMWGTYDQYAEIANELGQTTESVIRASGLYYQQGLETNEAISLATDTMKLATLAGLDFEQATSLMTAAIRGFHMEMNQGTHVTDVYSELAAKAAASVNDIAQAMSRTASIANSAGMSFENTSAMLTTMIEATQESPENLGTAMKTIIARFTELKNNVSAADSEFDDLDLNKVDKALKSIGVSLKDTNGQFRNIDTVLLETSEKWNTLDRNTQRYIATIAAGSRQQSRFIALMENYDRTMELIDTAQDSAGKSAEQFAKYQDSVENKINRLKNSWEQLRLSFLKSDTYKTVIDGLNNIVKSISKIDGKRLLAIAVIGTTLGKTVVKQFINTIQSSSTKISGAWNQALSKGYQTLHNQLTGKLDMSLAIKRTRAGLEELRGPLKNISDEEVKMVIEWKQQLNTVRDTNVEILKLENKEEALTTEEQKQLNLLREKAAQEEKNLKIIEDEVYTKTKLTSIDLEKALRQNKIKVPHEQGKISSTLGPIFASGISTAITTGITMALSGADLKTILITSLSGLAMQVLPIILEKVLVGIAGLLGGPVVAAILVGAVVAAIGTTIAIYNSEEEKLKRRIKKAEKDFDAATERSSKAAESAKEAKDELQTFKDLAEKYKELSNIQYKTTEQQEEYETTLNSIKDLYPELVEDVNAEGAAIKIQNDLLDEQLDKLKEKQEIESEKSYEANVNTIVKKRERDLAKLDQSDSTLQKEKYSLEGQISDVKRYTAGLSKQEIQTYLSNGKELRNFLASQSANMRSGQTVDTWEFLATFEEIKRTDEKGKPLQAEEFSDEDIEAAKAHLQDYLSIYEQYDEKMEAITSSLEANEKKRKKIQEEEQSALKSAYSEYVNGFGSSEEITNFIVEEIFSKGIDVSNEKYSNQSDFNAIVGQEYSTLPTRVRTALKKEWGGTAEYRANQWDKLRTGNDDEIKKLFNAYVDGLKLLIQEELGQDLYKNLSEEEQNNYTEFIQNLSQYSYNELENMDFSWVDNDETGKKLLTNIKTKQSDLREQVAQVLTGTADGYSINLLDFLNIGIDEGEVITSSWSLEAIQALSNSVQHIIDTTGDQLKAKNYGTQLMSLLTEKGIGLDDFAKIENLFDFSKINATNIDSMREDLTKQIINLDLEGLGEGAAEEFVNGWFEVAKEAKLIQEGFSGTGEMGAFVNNAIETADKFYEVSGTFEKYLSAPGEYISVTTEEVKKLSSTLDSLKKDGVEGIKELSEYLSIDANGNMVANAKELANLYKMNTTEIGKQLKERYLLAKAEKDSIENKLNELKGRTNLTQAEEEQKKTLESRLKNYENLDEQYKESEEKLGEIVKIQEAWTKAVEKTKYDNINNQLKTLISNFSTWAKDQKEHGILSPDSTEGIVSSISEINSSLEQAGMAKYKLDYSSILTETTRGFKLNQKALEDYIDTLITYLTKTETAEQDNARLIIILKTLRQSFNDAKTELKDIKAEVDTTWQTYQDKLEAEAKARENLTEKIEAQAKAERELQEAYYGTENHKNKTDLLYNYQTQRTQLQDRQTRAKDNLENATPGEDLRAYINDYFQSAHDEIVNLQAQNELMNQHINNQKNILDTKLSSELARLKAEGAVDMSLNVADFYEEIDGRWYIDYDRLNAANIPDDISDYIEGVVEDMNNYAKSIEDNLDSIKAKEKELKDFQKQARNDYLNVVNKVAEVLKQKYQQEVDDVKDKYEAIKDADNDYLDALEEAINKQRELRNRANQWDDLAKQEKKLSLKMRDTSGANAKEVQKLQEDTQKKREELLDNTVDDIVKGLKEIYEEQQETRDAEIEYRQAVLDNKNLIEEATAIVNNWDSVEDAKAFFLSMDEEYIKASGETLEKLLEDVESYYADVQTYQEARLMDIETFAQTSADEVQHLTQTMSETMTTEADRAMNEITAKVDETINSAKDAVTSAINAVAEAQQNLTKAIQESADAWNAYTEAKAKADEGDNIPDPPDIDNSFGQLGWNHTGLKIVTDAFVNAAKAQGYHGYYNDSDVYLYGKDILPSGMEASVRSQGYQVFKTGGLVDYTGPAWVDGTPTQPEAFLNYEDTRNIGQLIDVLRSLNFTNQFNSQPSTNPSIGDTHIEININIENVSSDYDVDQAVERVRQDIVDIATQAGSTVILHK